MSASGPSQILGPPHGWVFCHMLCSLWQLLRTYYSVPTQNCSHNNGLIVEELNSESPAKRQWEYTFPFLLTSMFQKTCRLSILERVLLRQRQTWHWHSIFCVMCFIHLRVVFPAGEGGLAGMEGNSLKLLWLVLCAGHHLNFDFDFSCLKQYCNKDILYWSTTNTHRRSVWKTMLLGWACKGYKLWLEYF